MRPLSPPTLRGASLDSVRRRLDPALARGASLSAYGRVADAAIEYARVADARPTDVTALHLAAIGALEANEWADADRYARAALRRTERSPSMAAVMAHAAIAMGRHDEAFRIAVTLHRAEPTNASYALLVAEVCREAGDVDGFRRWALRGLALPGETLERDPIRLWLGHEWRDAVRRIQGHTPSASGAPEWDGEPTDAAVLVTSRARGLGGPGLWAGYGDVMMFGQFVRAAARRVGRLVLDVPRPLLELFRWTFRDVPTVECAHAPTYPAGSVAGLPAHDLRLAWSGLALVMGAPDGAPYLELPPGECADLGAGLHVGLAWGASDGDAGHVSARSAPLAAVAPALNEIPGAVLHSLQVGGASADADAFPAMRRHSLGSFAATARVATQLDVVVSVDAAVCHLAAGLGVPTLTLLAVAADWRWGFESERTDWWRAMRLLRQPRPGDWPAVARRAAELIAIRDLPPRLEVTTALSPSLLSRIP